MTQKTIDRISGAVGVIILAAFVLGLAHSISIGFAGFWGGLPFWIITLVTLALVIYDAWDTLYRSSR
jgi:hypothetical protein